MPCTARAVPDQCSGCSRPVAGGSGGFRLDALTCTSVTRAPGFGREAGGSREPAEVPVGTITANSLSCRPLSGVGGDRVRALPVPSRSPCRRGRPASASRPPVTTALITVLTPGSKHRRTTHDHRASDRCRGLGVRAGPEAVSPTAQLERPGRVEEVAQPALIASWAPHSLTNTVRTSAAAQRDVTRPDRRRASAASTVRQSGSGTGLP